MEKVNNHHLLNLNICLLFLNGCMQSTALLGPTIAVSSTGNIYQAGFAYGTNKAVEGSTGKLPSEHVSNYVKENKRKKIFKHFLKAHIKNTREKFSLVNNIKTN